MSINALVLGTLLTQPTQRTSQRGASFVTCRVRVASAGTGDSDSVVANCIAFDESTQRELLALSTGEQLAASGTIKVGVWTPADGPARPSVDMVVGKLLTPYSVSRRRKAAQAGNDQGDRQRDQRPTHDAWRAGAPAGRQQHRAPADDLDNDLSDVF